MRRISVVAIILIAFCAPIFAQNSAPAAKTPSKKAAPAAKAAPSVTPAPAAKDSAEKPSEAIPPLPTQATVESFLKHTFSYDPNVNPQVLSIRPSRAAGVAEVLVSLKTPQGEQRGTFYVMPDRKYAIAGGEMMPFGADPFAPAREILSKANGPSRGPEDAPVTIVEFSDLECPACKAAQPTVEKLIAAEPNAKFIFQNYPLENLHPWAMLGAEYASCVAKQSKEAFWKFVPSVYQNQEAITALLPTNAKSFQEAITQGRPAISKKLEDLAAQAGANTAQLTSCISEPSTQEHIKKSMALGNELDITGTPTLFINGRRIQNVTGVPFELLKAMVDADQKSAIK